MCKLLLIIFASICIGPVYGQKKEKNDKPSKLYFKLYTGKGLLTPGSYRVNSSVGFFYTDPSFAFHVTSKRSEGKKGLGNAFRIGGGIGIVQTDFLNIGLDVEWMMKDKSTNQLNIVISPADHGNAKDNMSYSMITMTPYMIFKALAKPNFFIYNKLGVLLTLPFTLNTNGSTEQMSVWKYQKGNYFLDGVEYPNSHYGIEIDDAHTYDIKYKMSLGIGVNVAFGINYRLNDKLRLFGEIFGNYTGLSPATSVSKTYTRSMTTLTIDSTNFRYESPQGSETISNNHTVYKKAGEISIVGPELIARKYSINMSAIGINVGIVRRFR